MNKRQLPTLALALLMPLFVEAQTVTADFCKKRQTILANGINMEGYHVGQWDELREDFAAMLRQLPCQVARIGAPMIEWEPENDNASADEIRWEGFDREHAYITRSVNRIRRMKEEFGVDVWLSFWNLPDWMLKNPNPEGKFHPGREVKDMEEFAESICAFLIYIKEQTGVEVRWVSFNESLQQAKDEGGWGGYNTLLTVEDHRVLLRKSAQLFSRHGLKTKWMVGSLSVKPSELSQVREILADRELRCMIDAVDFHSYDLMDLNPDWPRRWGEYFSHSKMPTLCGELDNYKSDYKGGDWVEHGMRTGAMYSRVYNETFSAGSYPWFPGVPELASTYRYVDLHYFAHIPPGYTVVRTGSDDADLYAVAARKGKERVMILQNNSPREKTVRIRGFKKARPLQVFASYEGHYGGRNDESLRREAADVLLTMKPHSLYSVGTDLAPIPALE